MALSTSRTCFNPSGRTRTPSKTIWFHPELAEQQRPGGRRRRHRIPSSWFLVSPNFVTQQLYTKDLPILAIYAQLFTYFCGTGSILAWLLAICKVIFELVTCWELGRRSADHRVNIRVVSPAETIPLLLREAGIDSHVFSIVYRQKYHGIAW